MSTNPANAQAQANQNPFKLKDVEKNGVTETQPMTLYSLSNMSVLLANNDYDNIGIIAENIRYNCRTSSDADLQKFNKYALITGNNEYNKYLYLKTDGKLKIDPTKLKSYDLFQRFIDSKMDKYVFKTDLNEYSTPTFYKSNFRLDRPINSVTILPFNNKEYASVKIERNSLNEHEQLISNINNSLQRGIIDVLNAYAFNKQSTNKNKLTIDCSITSYNGTYMIRTRTFSRKFRYGIIRYHTSRFVLHTALMNPTIINPRPNRLDTVFSILGGARVSEVDIKTTGTTFDFNFDDTPFMTSNEKLIPVTDKEHFHDYKFSMNDVLYTTFGQITKDQVIIFNERGIFVMSSDFKHMSQMVLDGIDIMTPKLIYKMSDMVIQIFANYLNSQKMLSSPNRLRDKGAVEALHKYIKEAIFDKLPNISFENGMTYDKFKNEMSKAMNETTSSGTILVNENTETITNSPYYVYGRVGRKINCYDLTVHAAIPYIKETCRLVDDYYSKNFVPVYKWFFNISLDTQIDGYVFDNKELFGSLYDIYPTKNRLQFKLTINSLYELVYMLISLLPSRVVFGKDMKYIKRSYEYNESVYQLCIETVNFMNTEDISKVRESFDNLVKQIGTYGFPYN